MYILNLTRLANDSAELQETYSVDSYLTDKEVAGLLLYLAFFGFVGFVQNLVVILSIILTDGFPDIPGNIFVLSLACCDLLVCSVCVSLLIYNCFHWIFTTFITVSKLIVVATAGSIFLLTTNRFVSIIRPLRYPKLITCKRAAALVGCVWFVAIFVPTLSMIGLAYNMKAIVHITRYFLAFYIVSSSAMYTYMYILARKFRRELAQLKYAVTGQLQTSSDEFRSLRSLFIVAGTFAVCWLPMTIGFFLTDRNTDPDLFYRSFSFTAPLIVLNAVLDPTIYYFRSRGFRHSLKTLAKTFRNVTSR